MNLSSSQPRETAVDARCRDVVFAEEPRRRVAPARESTPFPSAAPSPETAQACESSEFFEWLCRARGIGGKVYRPSVVHRRRAACLRAAGCASIPEALDRLSQDDERLDRALSAVLIGVTSFFRDGAPFQALARELERPAWRRRRELTVLSVGCSEGQELYTAGMVVGSAGLLDRSSLWGVDCRADAIRKASVGVYPEAGVAELPAALRARWFDARRGAAQIKPELRERAQWRTADAFAFREPAAADIVLCRNLAIYFRPEAAQAFWSSVVARIRPGGLLLVGKAERPASTRGLARIGPCLYQKAEMLLDD